ncbi:MAG: hypothetical protein Q4G49_08530 [Paracoccus sp. (in: a-proteobacteria)]|nr:hypothetical protein [Paracoccus sp. (in: a-proteobacteria)]
MLDFEIDDVFTDRPFSGNLLTIVLDADALMRGVRWLACRGSA